MNTDSDARPKFMRFVRGFAVPILVAWLLLTVALNVLVPPIESVARNHAVHYASERRPEKERTPKID
jgi:putative drug exporter of the RND superfamily